MRILAFSDLHDDSVAARAIAAASASADVLVGAGDYGTCGTGGNEVLDILLVDSPVPVVLVHGNHDDPARVQARCNDSTAGHYLHGDATSVLGVTFFGVGGEIPLRTEAPWNVGEGEREAGKLLARCPSGSVLVTHSPPFGSADMQPGGQHEGSLAIRAAIRTRQPVLHLCGHIHNAWQTKDAIGATRILNLGPGLTWIEI